jgi:hypothetical protein
MSKHLEPIDIKQIKTGDMFKKLVAIYKEDNSEWYTQVSFGNMKIHAIGGSPVVYMVAEWETLEVLEHTASGDKTTPYGQGDGPLDLNSFKLFVETDFSTSRK